jgi:hypothetical protein
MEELCASERSVAESDSSADRGFQPIREFKGESSVSGIGTIDALRH